MWAAGASCGGPPWSCFSFRQHAVVVVFCCMHTPYAANCMGDTIAEERLLVVLAKSCLVVVCVCTGTQCKGDALSPHVYELG